jgi:bacteriocin-like protein
LQSLSSVAILLKGWIKPSPAADAAAKLKGSYQMKKLDTKDLKQVIGGCGGGNGCSDGCNQPKHKKKRC